ncbi:hypothetical protein BH09DEP1_BH09DEP1_4600 [soil metagenome]
MKFMVDECVGPTVAQWLKSEGHDVVSSYDAMLGFADDEVLKKALRETRILITSDKDFGEMVFRQQMDHCGIILLRFSDERPLQKIKIIQEVLNNYSQSIEGNFLVATENSVRIVSVQH